MGLLDNLEPPQKVWACKVRDTAAGLDAADEKALLEAVMNPAWAYSTLENELAKRGLRVGQQQIKAHRLGKCSCSKI
jgi:hypothetical protein